MIDNFSYHFWNLLMLFFLIGTVLAVIYGVCLLYLAWPGKRAHFRSGGWQKYPENEPEEPGYYWITLRGNSDWGLPLDGKIITLSTVHLVTYYEGKFYWVGGMSDMEINEWDDGKILAFMPLGERPEPFGGVARLEKEVSPEPWRENE